jgi:sporulation protein YlmC with PRC-barrel domain
MAMNSFDESRIAEGTIDRGGQHPNVAAGAVESSSISRDDVRDGAENVPAECATQLRRVLTASTLVGDRVRNSAGENLGSIEEIMIDTPSGRVAYAVLSFGGFLGIGSKLFAVPWSAMRLDEGEHEFVLDVDRQTLENAPGFDKDNWPDMADPAFEKQIHGHYGTTPYSEDNMTEAGDYIGDNSRRNERMENEPNIGYDAAESK